MLKPVMSVSAISRFGKEVVRSLSTKHSMISLPP
jgi:hypothetical protein